MKHQFNGMLFCIFASVTFLLSCKKESTYLQKRDSPIQKNQLATSPKKNEGLMTIMLLMQSDLARLTI